MWDESLQPYKRADKTSHFFAILSITPLSRFLSGGTDMQSLPSIFETQPLLVPGIENVYVDRV